MSELKSGTFRPVYYLMGEEGYFTDRITDYIMENVLNEFERDFNMTVYYGLDTDIDGQHTRILIPPLIMTAVARHEEKHRKKYVD